MDRPPTSAGLAQFVRFGLVGLANTAASYCVIWLLAPRMGVPVASTAGYAAGVLQSFVLNRLWTFKTTRTIAKGLWAGEALRFGLVNIICGGLFAGFTTVAAPHIGLLAATVGGVALVMPLGFILNRFIVFR